MCVSTLTHARRHTGPCDTGDRTIVCGPVRPAEPAACVLVGARFYINNQRPLVRSSEFKRVRQQSIVVAAPSCARVPTTPAGERERASEKIIIHRAVGDDRYRSQPGSLFRFSCKGELLYFASLGQTEGRKVIYFQRRKASKNDGPSLPRY